MPHVELSPETPLYDPTKPIACTIDAADIPKHVARLERIRSQLTRIDRTAFGVVLVPAGLRQADTFPIWSSCAAEEKQS